MKEEILKLISDRGQVSFAEMTRIEGFRGENMMSLDSNQNLVLWAEMSTEAANALQELRDSGQIHFRPCSIFTYLVDGISLQMPVARTLRKYKRPHWLPVVWDLGQAM